MPIAAGTRSDLVPLLVCTKTMLGYARFVLDSSGLPRGLVVVARSGSARCPRYEPLSRSMLWFGCCAFVRSLTRGAEKRSEAQKLA
jgi:hypothetical protein